MYDAPWEWPFPISLQPVLLTLPPNPIVVPTLLVQSIPQTPPPFLEPLPPYTLSPFSEHIEP